MNFLPHLYRTVTRRLSPSLKMHLLSKFSFTTTAMSSNIHLFEANIPIPQQQHNGQQFEQKQQYFERPTPIVFVSGEGLSWKIWQNSMSYFSCRGYGGAAISLDYSLPDANIDSHIATLHQHIEASHFTPPFMIAHSLSSFIAQKYLESWPLSGLMMINPISHDPKQDIEYLMTHWNKQQQHQKQQSEQQSQSQKQRSDVCAYYHYPPNNGSLTTDMISNNSSSPSTLISDKLYQELISDHKDVKVNLESGVVPMSIVFTDTDKHHLTHEKLQSLCRFHDIIAADVFYLEGCKHRLPMLCNDMDEETRVLGGESRVLSDEKASFNLNDIMYNWIESLP